MVHDVRMIVTVEMVFVMVVAVRVLRVLIVETESWMLVRSVMMVVKSLVMDVMEIVFWNCRTVLCH